MSTEQQATLDAYTASGGVVEADPSEGGGGAENASCAPNGNVDNLAEIFHTIVGDYETVEEQEETPSHAPVESGHEVPDLTEDGLDDAADSDLMIGGWT